MSRGFHENVMIFFKFSREVFVKMSRDFFGEMCIKKSGDAQLGKFCCATKRGGVAQQRKFPWATEKILLGKGKISLGQENFPPWAREHILSAECLQKGYGRERDFHTHGRDTLAKSKTGRSLPILSAH